MHLLTNARPVPLGTQGSLQPGTWLVEDADAAQIMGYAGGGECRLVPFQDPQHNFSNGELAHGYLEEHGCYNRTLIIRPGRFGDLILLTPVLKELKRLYPERTLAVATLPAYRDALIGLPYIDEFVSYPVDYHAQPVSTWVGSLEVLTSLAEKESTTHITDLFAERVGVEPTDKKPDVFLTYDEREWAFNNYPSTQKNRVAIQVNSSTPSRDYPREMWVDVIRRLHGRKWDVVLLGAPDSLNFKGATVPGIWNCTAEKLTFRQSAAVLSTANVFLGPDSSLIHVAGALGVPALGLFASVPWDLRTKYCPKTFAIQRREGCDLAPCFHAPRNAKGFPSEGPCAKSGRCEPLASILPEEIVDRLEGMV